MVPSSHPFFRNKTAATLSVKTANNETMKSLFCGTTPSPVPGSPPLDVHAIESLAEPLLSVCEITDCGSGVLFLKDKALFISHDFNLDKYLPNLTIQAVGSRDGRSYYIDCMGYEDTVSSNRVAQSSCASLLTWHYRLSHLSLRGLQDLRRQNKIHVSLNNEDEVMRCKECIKGKFNRLNLKSREGYKVTDVLAHVHSYLCQLPFISRSGYKYIMTFVDEASHFAIVFLLKSKSDAFDSFKRFVKQAERKTGMCLKCLRSDNGRDYVNSAWKSFNESHGITHSTGPPYSPELNGVAERYNRTLLSKILPNLVKSNLPVRFWEDATQHAVHSANRSPSQSIPNGETPFSVWANQPTSCIGLKTFGCKVWHQLLGPQRSDKLSPKARPCLHLHSLPDGDGWMVWDLVSQSPMKSRDVVFHEDCFPGLGATGKRTLADWESWELKVIRPDTVSPSRQLQPEPSEDLEVLRSSTDQQLEPLASIHNPDRQPPSPLDSPEGSPFAAYPPAHPVSPVTSVKPTHPVSPVASVDAALVSPGPLPTSSPSPAPSPSPFSTPPPEPVRRSSRQSRPVDRYGFAVSALLMREEAPTPLLLAIVVTANPVTFKEAVGGHDRESCLEAMSSEIKSLLQNKVFDLVPLPPGKKVIGCRWHFRIKPSVDGVPGRNKARLVAKGYLQRKGIDYQDTYAPSTCHETVCLLLSHMAAHAWESCQMEFMTAFLNSLLQEEVYLKQPEGYIDPKHPISLWIF